MNQEVREISIEQLSEDSLVMQLIRTREELEGKLKGTITVQDAKKGDDIHTVHIYTIDGVKYVHKKSDSTAGMVSEKAGKALCVDRAGVPAPKVLFSNDNEILEEFLEGSPLDSNKLPREEVESACCDLGRVFKQLHSVNVAGYGLFRSEEVNEYDTLAEYYARLKERNMPRARKSGLFSGEQLSKIENIFNERIDNPGDHKPVLTHQDIGLQNVFTQNGKISGLIDFADSQGSIPPADFARLYIQQKLEPENPSYFDLVKETYGEINQNELNFFVVLTLIKLIIYKDPSKIDEIAKMQTLLEECLV